VVLPLRRDRAAGGLGTAAAAAVYLGCWTLLHHWLYARHQIVDTPIYQGYGNDIDHGLLPYRDFPVEYPPGSLPVFVAPVYLFGYASYAHVFGWLMAALGICCLVAAALAGAGVRGLAFIAVSPLLIGSMVLSRYDLWPTLFVVCALAALLHDRHRPGWLALVVATVLPFVILAPHGLWHSVSGQMSRPLQIESLGASLLTTFSRPHVIATHGSLNLGGEGTVAAVTTALELVVLIALWIGFARGPAARDRLVRYTAACICAFVVLGKVLSPQFLIWLVPLVPLVRGVRGLAASLLLVAALIATQVYFPQRYWEYIFHLHLACVVLMRNAILVALLATLSLPQRERARSA